MSNYDFWQSRSPDPITFLMIGEYNFKIWTRPFQSDYESGAYSTTVTLSQVRDREASTLELHLILNKHPIIIRTSMESDAARAHGKTLEELRRLPGKEITDLVQTPRIANALINFK